MLLEYKFAFPFAFVEQPNRASIGVAQQRFGVDTTRVHQLFEVLLHIIRTAPPSTLSSRWLCFIPGPGSADNSSGYPRAMAACWGLIPRRSRVFVLTRIRKTAFTELKEMGLLSHQMLYHDWIDSLGPSAHDPVHVFSILSHTSRELPPEAFRKLWDCVPSQTKPLLVAVWWRAVKCVSTLNPHTPAYSDYVDDTGLKPLKVITPDGAEFIL